MFLLVTLVSPTQVGTALGDDRPAPVAKQAQVTEPPITEPLVITQSVALDPAKTYGPLVIRADNITIDGAGAVIRGDVAVPGNQRTGVGVFAQGVSGVTLKNLRVRGFATGIEVTDGAGWTIQDCDCSDNFHDPEFGWGEQGRRGGLVLTRVSKSRIVRNRANRVWDGCSLAHCDENEFEHNDFSYTSNTCLRLWTSSRNVVRDNQLDYGLRISPGEVHARDSTCVLIENGCRRNQFLRNSCTHGGDGIFIRVLNGWVSTDNLFEENDCSYANNNGVECWAPRNTFRRNTANHCSYGFWMGGSDQTRLEENVACHNGLATGFHNSPHLPQEGHAGIVFMFGPGSHVIARDNVCCDNHGAGLALIGDLQSQGRKWKGHHWIVEHNRLERNRWGLYFQYADWLDLTGNTFDDNSASDIEDAGGVTRLSRHEPSGPRRTPPRAVIRSPRVARAGEEVTFDASGSAGDSDAPLQFAWDLGDGTMSHDATVRHTFSKPGYYRVGLTILGAGASDLGWVDFYAVDAIPEPATEGPPEEWSFVPEPNLSVEYRQDHETRIAGDSSVEVRVDPYHGQRATLVYGRSERLGWAIAGKSHLVLWLRAENPNLPGWQDVNPVVTLFESAERRCTLTPKFDLLSQEKPNEAREGWLRLAIPLAGDEQWTREGEVSVIQRISLGIDSWGGDPLHLWIDGLGLH